MKYLIPLFLAFSLNAHAATITIVLPDDVVRARIEYVCEPGRVQCEGKTHGQIVFEAIDSILAKTGFSTWMLSKLGLDSIESVSVSYD